MRCARAFPDAGARRRHHRRRSKIYVVLRVQFKPDGSMSREPVLVEGTASPLGPALAESAKRALLLCQPFTMLKPEHYDQWKDIEIKFDPRDIARRLSATNSTIMTILADTRSLR